MDAAFFNILQNKSYFYSDDRYFVFDHRTDGISLSEEGSLETTRPWLPIPLDAAYKSSKVRNGKINHQVYVVVSTTLNLSLVSYSYRVLTFGME